jgi:hypothetical protein
VLNRFASTKLAKEQDGLFIPIDIDVQQALAAVVTEFPSSLIITATAPAPIPG